MNLLVFTPTAKVTKQMAECTKFNSSYYTCPSEENAANIGLITFTFLIGCSLGAIIVSMLADLWGRKKSIIAAGLGFLVGGFIQGTLSYIQHLTHNSLGWKSFCSLYWSSHLWCGYW